MPIEVSATLARAGVERRYQFRATGLRTVIHGPTGSGKTTLLRILAGLEPRARGHVSFNGHRWQTDGNAVTSAGRAWVPPEQRDLGYVPQEALLFPHLSVRANLAFSPRARPAELEAISRRLELSPLLERAPRGLSGGERQLVALGRALASSPRLLLLDEAFSALHRELKVRVLRTLRDLTNERGLTTLLVSHQTDDAALFEAESHLWEPAAAAVPDLQQRGVPDSEHLPSSGVPELNSR